MVDLGYKLWWCNCCYNLEKFWFFGRGFFVLEVVFELCDIVRVGFGNCCVGFFVIIGVIVGFVV